MPFKPRIATEAPKTLEVRREIMKAIQALADDENQQLARRRAEIAALRRDLQLLRRSLPGLMLQAINEARRECEPVLQAYVQKYNPDEPRVPAGNSDGGEWTSGGASGSSIYSTPSTGANADGLAPTGVQYAQLDTGARTDASGGGAPISASDIPADDPKHPVPLVDSSGKPITDDQGNPLLRPADLPPEMYVREGLAVRGQFVGALTQDSGALLSWATAALVDELLRFGQGGPWDAQRVQGQVVSAYRDYATIAIGLYMAAAGVPIQIALSLENIYAALFSNFDPSEPKDGFYSHLPTRNVRNTEIGYELYDSGRISVDR